MLRHLIFVFLALVAPAFSFKYLASFYGVEFNTNTFQGRTNLFMAGFGAKTASNNDDKPITASSDCPCGSGALYQDCCKPYHDEGTSPAMPAKLVRARFSSLVVGNAEYMLKTTHPSHNEFVPEEKEGKRAQWLRDVVKYSKANEFLSLVFDSTTDLDTVPDGDEAYVSFEAKLKAKGSKKIDSIKEKSTFLRGEDGQWQYAAGTIRRSAKDMKIIRPSSKKMITTKKIGVPDSS